MLHSGHLLLNKACLLLRNSFAAFYFVFLQNESNGLPYY